MVRKPTRRASRLTARRRPSSALRKLCSKQPQPPATATRPSSAHAQRPPPRAQQFPPPHNCDLRRLAMLPWCRELSARHCRPLVRQMARASNSTSPIRRRATQRPRAGASIARCAMQSQAGDRGCNPAMVARTSAAWEHPVASPGLPRPCDEAIRRGEAAVRGRGQEGACVCVRLRPLVAARLGCGLCDDRRIALTQSGRRADCR